MKDRIKKINGIKCFIFALTLFTPFQLANANGHLEQKERVVEQLSMDTWKDKLRLPKNELRTKKLEFPNFVNQDINIDSSPSVIGGTDAARREYSEYSLIIFTDGRGNVTGLCGGTLIASNRVLTAAHCAQDRASNYFVIPSFYSFADRLTQSNLYRVSEIVSHPGYNSSTFDNDVAIFTLSRITSGSFTRAKVHSGSNKLAGKSGTLIGTGLISTNPANTAERLQKSLAPITSNSACNAAWERLGGIRPITENMMCAGFANNGTGSCSGDSGGPLFANINDQRVIVGTVSFGASECEQNRATQGYARMSAFTDFIRSQSPDTELVVSNSFAFAPIMMLLEEPAEIDLSIESLSPTIAPFSEGKHVLSLASAAGETVGRGKNYLYDSRNSNLTVELMDDNSVVVRFRGSSAENLVDSEQSWSWKFGRSGNKRLSPGIYRRAERYNAGAISSPRTSNQLLAQFFPGGQCVFEIEGEFRILDIEYVDSKITRLVADFVQRCGGRGRPQLNGSIIYDESNTDFDPLFPSTGTLTASPAVLAPMSSGANVEIRVDPEFVSGISYSLSPSNSVSAVQDSFDGFRFSVSDAVRNWVFGFAKPTLDADPDDSKRLKPGIYRNAKDSILSKTSPTLYTSGVAYCGFLTQTGEFRVFDISYPEDSDIPDFFVLDFVMRCEDSDADKLRVSIHYDNRPTL